MKCQIGALLALTTSRKWMEEQMKTINVLLIALFLSLSFSQALASGSADLASSKSAIKNCVHIDGDGGYSGSGTSMHAARSSASIQCVNHKVDNYEARTGRLPDADTYDMMIDACVNICK